MITITLSTADATAHLLENPYWPASLGGHRVLITLALITLLGAVFLRGFTDATEIAVALVGTYLALNAIVLATALWQVMTHPHVVVDWGPALTAQHGNPALMVGLGLLTFPKLALGLSGFETGVAVMPQIRGAAGDSEDRPAGRIRGTWLFRADVGAQGSAYATGVLVLVSSAALAVTLAQARRHRRGRTIGFALITAVFGYTTIVNIVERPDGVKIAGCFIAAIVVVSVVSRIHRSLDLRAPRIELDALADRFVGDCSRRTLRLVAHEPVDDDERAYYDSTGHRPHIYFRWSEGNPALNYLRYLLFGHGELAPVTREILRRHVADPGARPHVHAG